MLAKYAGVFSRHLEPLKDLDRMLPEIAAVKLKFKSLAKTSETSGKGNRDAKQDISPQTEENCVKGIIRVDKTSHRMQSHL